MNKRWRAGSVSDRRKRNTPVADAPGSPGSTATPGARMRIALPLLLLLAVGLLALGCGGPKKLQARGRILKNGEVYHPPGEDSFRVTLIPMPEDGSRPTNYYAALYDPKDGTFVASGPDRKGVPPGKYRVAVELLHDRNDVLRGAFGEEKSPFIREIHSSSDDMTVDLGKPK